MQLLLLFGLVLTAAPARADWSCVTRDGRLKICASLSRCQKLYPACAAPGPIDDLECTDPECRFAAPGTLATPAPPSRPPRPKRLFKPGELPLRAAPSLQARGEKLLEEVRTLVHAPHRETGLSKTRGASGLSPEQEARLFGGGGPPSLSAADRARLVTEFARDSELRNEVRRQLASRTSGEHAYDSAAAAALNAVLAEAEGGPKAEVHVKPLAPDEAFGAQQP